MKISFSLKKQEANLEADIEKLVEKGMDNNLKNPDKKTRYQIKQEEKRKNKELEQKHFIQNILLMAGIILFIFSVCFMGSLINW